MSGGAAGRAATAQAAPAVRWLRRAGLDPMVYGLRALSDRTTRAPQARSLLLGAVLGGTVWPVLLVARGLQRAGRALRQARRWFVRS